MLRHLRAVLHTKSILLFFKLKADNAFDVFLTDGALSIIKYLALTHKCHSLESQLVDIPSRTNFVVECFLLTPANIKLDEEHSFMALSFFDIVHVTQIRHSCVIGLTNDDDLCRQEITSRQPLLARIFF